MRFINIFQCVWALSAYIFISFISFSYSRLISCFLSLLLSTRSNCRTCSAILLSNLLNLCKYYANIYLASLNSAKYLKYFGEFSAVLIACMNQQNFPHFMWFNSYVSSPSAGCNNSGLKEMLRHSGALCNLDVSCLSVCDSQLAQIFHGTINILFIYFRYLFIYVYLFVVRCSMLLLPLRRTWANKWVTTLRQSRRITWKRKLQRNRQTSTDSETDRQIDRARQSCEASRVKPSAVSQFTFVCL